MVGELITLPLRLTGSAVRLWWRAADQALGLASDAAGHLIERVSPPASPAREAGPSTAARSAPQVRPVPARSPTASLPAASEPRLVSPVEEPMHVSEEPELVQELAETGAEGGAGPELHIREPWKGYRDMSAREVTARLADMPAAELAAVELYETSHRGRQTILDAVARQLRSQPRGEATQPSGANGHSSL